MTIPQIDWSLCLASNTEQSKVSPVNSQAIKWLTKHLKCKWCMCWHLQTIVKTAIPSKDKQHPITPPSGTNSNYIPPKKIDTKRQTSPKYATQQNKFQHYPTKRTMSIYHPVHQRIIKSFSEFLFCPIITRN